VAQVTPWQLGDSERPEILEILEERTQSAHNELAGRTDAGADVLCYLAEHGGAATRREVAANRATPATANRLLSNDDDDEVRAELARKIARLMPDLSRDEMLHLREETIDTLETLARDQTPRVRAILAEEIKHLSCVPKTVIDALARDVEEVVAAPILEYSPLLSDVDLIEVIACARANHAISAIAKRQPLSHDVSDAIVATLDVPAMTALLANPKASIREETFEKLVESAESVAELHHPLVMRSDLSTRTIRRLAGFVGKVLLESLATRDGLDGECRAALDRRLRERLSAGESAVSSAHEAARTVALAAWQGQLNEEFVEQAAKAGNRESVILALATLARVPRSTVQRIVDSRSAKAITALVWKARLPMRIAFKIQSDVAKLTARELLPARNGRDFPLSEQEMRWQLGYFDVPLA